MKSCYNCPSQIPLQHTLNLSIYLSGITLKPFFVCQIDRLSENRLQIFVKANNTLDLESNLQRCKLVISGVQEKLFAFGLV